MGISGLLPLLKSIQVQKHLSDFSGQTLAIDGYVWLHRGTYGCATELATGKHTTKYVEYAMQRVRLLRYHGIQPYVVLDGGPLPAKRGTEVERRQRRAENLARGNALAAQGRHAQARECYCKCVDVTPQMAYQLTKALRAENVPYIVAPYEADAQLAYLERTGIVDGIITEDSDLLVFGCKQVLFKLDYVAETLVSISRSDFGDVQGMSLRGWSDVQFREMAILSGCDYLPSIQGVGLKTAWSLLRKHKTVEGVIKALRFEGKKGVPKGYLEAFRQAEKVFLHQRVYDPVEEKLVHLLEIPDGDAWSAEYDAYVGENMEPALAKRVATGEADPCTLLPMEDINPSYVPRSVKPLPLKPQDLNRSSSSKEKGKQNAKSSSVSILNFLAPKEQISSAPKSASQPVATQRITVGRASGKRTLAGVMEADMAAKRMKREASLSEPVETPRKAHVMTQSRFFGAVAGPSRIRATEEFEEIETQKEVIFIDDTDDGEMQEPEEADPVTQEDGYLSPAASLTRLDTPDLSSPPRPPGTRPRRGTDDFGAERLSSPVLERARSESPLGRPHASAPRVLVQDTPMRKRAYGLDGPDLRDLFDEEEDAGAAPQSSFSTQSSTSGPETPADVDGDLLELDEVPLGAARQAVAKGWWTKWARAEAGPAPLRRRETTVTPDGRHKAFRFRPHTAPAKTKTTARGKLKGGARTPSARKSLVFEDTDRGAADGQWDARARLAAYRCPPR